MTRYNPKKIEIKWQKVWENNWKSFSADEKSKKPKFYCLDMFPYPSGDGLHVGHVESYTASDIISRYERMKGKNVLHPIGWDAFGLPAENYAIKTGIHPAKSTRRNIKNFTRQIKSLGFSYDWSREIDTSDPAYYKWTQWFFLFLYKRGLAYRKKAKVNWCESCKTVLANEQVENGSCERCKNEVTQKELEQWFFKITDFAEDLINDLDKVDWPESTKIAQKNWIGKSEGATIKFKIQFASRRTKSKIKGNYFLEVFTTRLDTIYGCTYCVLAPENELIENLRDSIENYKDVKKYIEKAKKKTDLQRTELQKEKTGVELKGIKAINPFTSEAVPIFVADYILSTYGTGAVMAVPAHDERDWEFAKKYKLKIKEVIKSPNKTSSVKSNVFVNDGLLIESSRYSGMTSLKAREEMAKWLEKKNLGGKKTIYRLRDWLISRQRYWGAPIPIIYCENCVKKNNGSSTSLMEAELPKAVIDGKEYVIVPVPEKDLPVKLPTDVDFRPKGESPLKLSKVFHKVKCPVCGARAMRESDTMDTFVCSSWYYFRYADPRNKKEFASRSKIKKWLPVDLYIGGAEHVVLHLLYSRFFTKTLHRYGYINFNEPFLKLRHQGIVLAEDGRKMSKSLGNVVNPDDIVRQYGADTLRLYEMFMGPLEDAKAWNTKSIIGLRRFLERVWKLQDKISKQNQIPKLNNSSVQSKFNPSVEKQNPKLSSLLHKTIKKVTEDIENLRFNTAISALMILLNEFERQNKIFFAYYSSFIILLAPFAPHITEEIWSNFGHKASIFLEKWPQYNPKLVEEEGITFIIQVNGKVRDEMKVSADIGEKEARDKALELEKIRKYIPDTGNIKKIIFIPRKLINFVL